MKKILLICFLLLTTINASQLKSDEYLMFVPSVAYDVNESKILVNVEAWVYEKELGLGLTTILASYIGLDKDSLSKEERAKLYERTQLFRVDSERGKELKIKFSNGVVFELIKTDSSGRSSNQIILDKSIIDSNNEIKFSVFDSGVMTNAQAGTAYYSAQNGISVVSDIDDTIKYSNVLDKKELLLNTFLNDFKPILNMSEKYQNLAKIHKNVSFHYVSSSPIQLYPLLQEFLNDFNFPKGSLHLREGTSWDKIISSKDESRNHKLNSIKNLLINYPDKKFILIGDSGENDPEIYATLKKEFSLQIILILIRDVTDENAASQRYKELFKDTNENEWNIF